MLGIARPGEREARKHTRGFHAGQFVLIEEVVIAVPVAKEQPIAPRRPGRHALAQEGAERRDPGAGADHDDGHRRVGRQREVLRFLHIDLDLVARGDPVGEKRGGDTEPGAAVDGIAHGIDAECDAAAVGFRGRGHGVEPGL